MGFSRQEYWSGVPSPSPIVVSNFIHLCSNLCYIPFSNFDLYLFFFSSSLWCEGWWFILDFSCFLRQAFIAMNFPLRAASLYPINFGKLHFLFLFLSRSFLFPFYYSWPIAFFSGILLNIHILVNFPVFFVLFLASCPCSLKRCMIWFHSSKIY